MLAADFTEDKQYHIGVIGDIPALLTFWEMFKEQSNDAVLREIGFVAAALPNKSEVPDSYMPDTNLPTYADYRQMLEKHPEINMVLEATGRAELVAELRSFLPSHMTLVERGCANFFIKLLVSDKIWVACKMDLMHTQNMLKTIVDQLDDELLFLGLDGTVLDLNQPVVTNLSVKKSGLIGLHFNDVFLGMCVDGADCPLQETLRTGERAEGLSSIVADDGRVRYYRTYTYPIHDETDTLCNVVALRRDITRRMEMEHRLQQTEKLASIGELSTYIAHEIRNPLFAISGFANSLIRSEGIDDAARNKLDIILTESRRLDEILKAVMNFTRPTDAKVEDMDLNEVVTSTMKVMRLKCDEECILVNISLDPEVARVKADPEQIKQCLINLVKNGSEAMPNGGTLTVATAMAGDKVVLEVADTGEGIPREIRDKVFSPFFSTRGKGSGLGLAMVRKILEEIGGDVELTSKEGEGTAVTLFMPPSLAG